MAKNDNSSLGRAKKQKKDEFYTRLEDIERELAHYKEHFRGKTVLCNCDDPRVSNFFHYFSYQFERLGLKRLITTCYKNQERDLFSQNASERAIWLEYTGDKNGNRIPDPAEIGIRYLKGDGDFRSEECIELLKQADIVVTNPPFSLFREYVAQLVKYDKKFLIIGNVNAVKYKEIFPLIRDNQVWLGATGFVTDMVFGVPEGTNIKDSDKQKAERLGYVGNYTRLGNSCWFTNVDHGRRHQPLRLMTMAENFKHSKHKEIRGREDYIHYENYDAIEIPYTDAIPSDYEGAMGLPKSFLDKYCPEQFEIIGIAEGDSGKELGLKPFPPELKKLNPSLRQGQLYYMEDGYPVKPYARILIRKKQSV